MSLLFKTVSAVVALMAALGLSAQEAAGPAGRWDSGSLGNHRAVVRVEKAVDAVRVRIPSTSISCRFPWAWAASPCAAASIFTSDAPTPQ